VDLEIYALSQLIRKEGIDSLVISFKTNQKYLA